MGRHPQLHLARQHRQELLTGWFEKLSEGGNVGVPLAPQQWGAVFGHCMDRYGIEWMVNIYQG